MWVRAYERDRPAGNRYDGEVEVDTELALMLSLSVYMQRKKQPLIVISNLPSGAKRRTFIMKRRAG